MTSPRKISPAIDNSHMTIGLFYGTSTCYTEMVAEKIAANLNRSDNNKATVGLYNITEESLSSMELYDHLIIGTPTWDYGELQEDWEKVWNEIDTLNISDKTVALFGLGDQIGHPEWFLDAMGYLWAKIYAQGGITVGYWPVSEFKFNQSKAMNANQQYFVGLAIDDKNQFELTDKSISSWCAQVYKEFQLKTNLHQSIKI
ncbi:MAG: flavodoxin II [Porticoccus sp.]|jgi:flavodoxin II